jgi:glycerophosphoryl diester phosphodiesterase
MSARAPIIVAHRGLWMWNYPENSREAFAEAVKFGFPAECDVWESADGVPVVVHDQTLNRTTTGNGFVSDFFADQLRKIHLAGPSRSTDAPRIPMLADVANLVSLVEVKPPNSARLVDRVIRIMSRQPWTFQSFDPANLEHALAVDPHLSPAFLVDDPRMFDVAISHRWTVHCNHELLDDRTMSSLRDVGMRVGVWTVNTPAAVERVLRLGVDLIISDQPTLVQHMVRRAGLDGS